MFGSDPDPNRCASHCNCGKPLGKASCACVARRGEVGRLQRSHVLRFDAPHAPLELVRAPIWAHLDVDGGPPQLLRPGALSVGGRHVAAPVASELLGVSLQPAGRAGGEYGIGLTEEMVGYVRMRWGRPESLTLPEAERTHLAAAPLSAALVDCSQSDAILQ